MDAELEIRFGDRFEFGANWTRFLKLVDEERIASAELSLREMLGASTLDGRSFLDIGCGSGLFSLAARRLGAKVHSFDFDLRSVACAQELRRRYCPNDEDWQIEQGSILDRAYLERLGQFDIVYSWGVLHHTGAMWIGIEHAVGRTAENGGELLIAIYNDQGWKSHVWWLIKRVYNRIPRFSRRIFAGAIIATVHCVMAVKRVGRLGRMRAVDSKHVGACVRGMSAKHDWLDWIGGFPYEFASLANLESYLRARQFAIVRARATIGWGCNELLARKSKCVG